MCIDEYYIGCIASVERFSGIYTDVREVPTFGINPFDTQEWIDTNRANMLYMKKTIKQIQIPEHYFFTVIPVIKSKLLENGHVNIIDFGGGNGENYIQIVRFLGMENIEYHVIEQKRNCKAGIELQLSGNISFHENNQSGLECINKESKEILKKSDICLIIGTLQYFPEYMKLLIEIAESGVEYIFITRTIINSISDTYYTRQYIASNHGQYKDIIVGDIPVAVINHQELNKCMCNLGYHVCLDLFQTNYSNNFSNFPKPYCEVEYRDILYQINK